MSGLPRFPNKEENKNCFKLLSSGSTQFNLLKKKAPVKTDAFYIIYFNGY